MRTDTEFIDFFTDAIENKRVLKIVCGGHRTIEPHALGRSADGDLLLRAFQTEGASSSTPTKEGFGWRLFRLSAIAFAEALDQTFSGPREKYRQGDKKMKGGIIAELLAP